MFKRIFTLLNQDLANSLRDNLVTYMMVAPLLMALGAKFFLPSLDDIKIRVVLDGSAIEPALVEKFSTYGLVDVLDDRQEVVRRVEKNDDAIGLLVGGLSDTQIQAMAVLKILLFAYLTIPIVSIFVPRAWHFLFYILPNYWMFQIFISIFVGQVGQVSFWLACLLTLVSSLVFILALLPTLKKRLKLG